MRFEEAYGGWQRDRLTIEEAASLLGVSELIELPNQAIIVCAGGELPTPMLKKIGIQVNAHYGT